MHLLLILGLAAALFVAASFLAVYSWGRFARRARGTPSSALPPAESETMLDRGISSLERGAGAEKRPAPGRRQPRAFAVRAFAARNAGRSLDLQYYYWLDDLTGGLLAREVIAAADRGVRVRLLIDDINTRGDDASYLGLDRHPNIEVRLFNPSRSAPVPCGAARAGAARLQGRRGGCIARPGSPMAGSPSSAGAISAMPISTLPAPPTSTISTCFWSAEAG